MPSIVFTDTSGTRHELQMSAADQAKLLAQGSQRKQEQWLIAQQYLVPDLPEEATDPAPDPTEAIAALAAIEGRLAATEQQVQQFSTAEALGQLQLQLQLWSSQAGRVALSHAELAAVADQVTARCEATAAAAQARLNALDADQAAMATAIASQLTEAQTTAAAAIASATSRIDAALADARAEALSEARAVAAQQVGPQGQAGAATVLCLEDPLEVDAASFASRWLGRPLAEGDGALVIQSDQLLVRRFANGRWATGPSIIPRQNLIDAKISALDNSIKQTTTVTNVNTTIGGGGTLPLLRREVTLGGGNNLIPIARSYDWEVPSQFWGGDPTSSDYDQASWNRKPATAHSFHVRFIALDTNDLNNIAQEAFTVTKHLNGVTDITVYEVNYQGIFNDPAFGGLVADAQIFDIQQDFTVESGGLVTTVTGKELRLSFGPNGLAGTRPVQLSGTITPLTLRRQGI